MLTFEHLRQYQKEDAIFASKLPAAALFNEQRTGKTPTALYVLQLKGLTKNLIVAPASALYQWADEYETWLKQPCLVCVGTPNQRQNIINRWTHGLVISYDMLKMKTKKGTQIGELYNIKAAQPEAVILDEAHRIRNYNTATSKAAFSLINTPYRMALTGTPAPNKAYEVWAILHFLYPHTFSSYWEFIEKYFFSSRQINPKTNRTYIDIGPPTREGKYVLNYILKSIATNRKRKDVMTWLPEKDYVKIKLPLTENQKRYLHELQEFYETEHITTIGILDRLIRYRQICNDPKLLDLKGNSPKTDWLLQYLKDYPERSVIIFSKFTSYLHRLSELLPIKHGKIVGSTPVTARREICQQFQAGKLKILLLNIDAGKEALTLDRAEAAIFLDRFPPVGDLSQAEDRFIATTKEKADKLHLIYHVTMRDSFEQKIDTMISSRYSETDIINHFKTYMERSK